MTTADPFDISSLHTASIDARNGYTEALEDAEGKGLTALFQDMIQLHTQNANELKVIMAQTGEIVGDEGSFMSTVHRTIMSIRSLFGGLAESILPGLIDGEMRNVKNYDEALQQQAMPTELRALLETQRERISKQVSLMNAKV